MPLPNLTMRTAEDHHELMRRVNQRLRDDPAFVQVLSELVDDPRRTDFIPREEIESRFDNLEESVRHIQFRLSKIGL
ncbi:hypothetical protein R5H30_04865 [Sulfitobacter sp. D35]|uniref:hypothetical protein n=1 Tax=Sulfitobacter sp. D35 TaxID=3083252 RepID=UPI00296E8C2D|nr:hypothetical protein [Sulfitobacter sp. D35]MDW4497303.1 hypothetical protein [Sulfitobacter sp. D35]